jgi:hypothetical protein
MDSRNTECLGLMDRAKGNSWPVPQAVAGIPANGPDGEGRWGEKQPGRTATVVSLPGWLLIRKAARALGGSLIHEPPRGS